MHLVSSLNYGIHYFSSLFPFLRKIKNIGKFYNTLTPTPTPLPKKNLKWRSCTYDMRCCEISYMTPEQSSRLVLFILVMTHLSRFHDTKVFVHSEKWLKIKTSKTTVEQRSQKLFVRLTIKETKHTWYHYGSMVNFL